MKTETKIMKTETKKESAYSKWLKNLIGDKKYFEELTEEEVYKIILRISEITFSRNNILNLDHTFEDAAGNIYRNYLQRDFEKDLEDSISEEERNNSDKLKKKFPYYDEKSGKYFKEWKPRQICKGFQMMRDSHMTVTHFSNLMFRELTNHVEWHKRDKKFYNRINNTISLDYEDENINLSEIISDDKNCYEEVEKTSVYRTSRYIKKMMFDENEFYSFYSAEGYSIVIEDQTLNLSYKNLITLYTYLSKKDENDNRRISSEQIIKHITYKGNKELSRINIKYIGRFIKSFKEYLQDVGIVDCIKFIDDLGKERKRYGFSEQLY